ncbi:sensor histidine kinase [Niallia nealsonii]|uniref:Uncharacterized protein n=1 Tax=Niallia nealsonii TaxID=115979 RepID=A0A2N0Z5T0_9BACI|nr:sensor histidine kinase [Niallia nealsonii]PKG24844.1 hypothetical protein CWS01_04605 [Niallia nealsonii]
MISHLLQKFFPEIFNSFRRKLLFSFFIMSIIPLFLLGVLSYVLSYNIAKNKLLDSVSYSNNQLNEILANRFNQMENASNMMQYYMYTLILQSPSSLPEQLNTYSAVRNNIANLKNSFQFANISVYTKEDFLFSHEGITFFDIKDIKNHGISSQEMHKNINHLNWHLSKNIKEPFVLHQTYKKNNYISAYVVFKKQNSSEIDYAFFIDIKESEINKILQDSSSDSSISSFLVDENGLIISHRTESLLSKKLEKNLFLKIKTGTEKPFKWKNKQYIVKYNHVTNWYVITEVPNKYIVSNTFILVSILLATVIFVVIVSILSSLFTSNELSKKIRQLASIMTSISFNDYKNKPITLKLPIDENKKYKDEFDDLAIVFNKMTDKMNTNFQSLLDFKIQEEKMRFQLEQSKINPHFLYNMLDSIKTCQTLGRLEDANNMIIRLAKFYRMLLKKGDELISIKDELEIAILYLEMEKLNRNHSFTWHISKEAGIENFLIPKFVLQPILENCIHHGINHSDEIAIHISLFYKEEDILITIDDNGKGISDETCKKINGALTNNNVKTKQHFGLINVNKRLSMFSKSPPALQVAKREPSGTSVTLSLQQMILDEDLFDL